MAYRDQAYLEIDISNHYLISHGLGDLKILVLLKVTKIQIYRNSPVRNTVSFHSPADDFLTDIDLKKRKKVF